MSQILLLEPDKILAKTYSTALESAGHIVEYCVSAQTAVVFADNIRPDIVVVELQLVDHSGIEFLYEFRSYVDWQHIPVIILTNVPESEFSGSQLLLHDDLNVQVYLYKPLTSLRKLIQCVDDLTQVTIRK
jgi:DNA-binding response OmpR family regulator